MNPNPQRPTVSGPPQRKVFDVMRPGRAPANSTSKPVIVGHKPMVQDPSVTMNGVGDSRALLDSRKKIAITAHDAPAAVPVAVAPAPAPSAPAVPSMPAPEPPAAPEPPTLPAEPAAPEQPEDGPTVWPPRDEQPPPPLQPAVSPAETITSSIPDDTTPKPGVVTAPAAVPTTEPDAVMAPDDDLLATMPAPEVDGHHVPAAEPSHVGPTHIPLRWLIPVIIIVVLVIAILDILLDADFLGWSIPHTHFLQ
jgi:hypothetical protein